MKNRKIALSVLIVFIISIFATTLLSCTGNKNDKTYVEMEIGALEPTSSSTSLSTEPATSDKKDDSYDQVAKIHFVLDSKNKILSIDGIDDDGKLLLLEMNLKGKDLEDGVKEIYNHSCEIGFLANKEGDKINISVVSSKENKTSKAKKNVDKAIKKADFKFEYNVKEENISNVQNLMAEYNPQIKDIKNLDRENLFALASVTVDENSSYVNVDLQAAFNESKAMLHIDKDKLTNKVDVKYKKDVEKYLEIMGKFNKAQEDLDQYFLDAKLKVDGEYQKIINKLDSQYAQLLQYKKQYYAENTNLTEKEKEKIETSMKEILEVINTLKESLNKAKNMINESLDGINKILKTTVKETQKLVELFYNKLPEEVRLTIDTEIKDGQLKFDFKLEKEKFNKDHLELIKQQKDMKINYKNQLVK